MINLATSLLQRADLCAGRVPAWIAVRMLRMQTSLAGEAALAAAWLGN